MDYGRYLLISLLERETCMVDFIMGGYIDERYRRYVRLGKPYFIQYPMILYLILIPKQTCEVPLAQFSQRVSSRQVLACLSLFHFLTSRINNLTREKRR
jgi:hypothetical protein